ncbi:hypothetical protein [Saccharopolyspora hordei]|uniref:Uncharacterized protein n=1 Tax=Saccharopolyspora hordei TaxID=1838 RepID=A0A853AFX2_9PSEU|nr:hypothetical protein [Saccharopolyspora hordei]NYI83442.1 hypothetical protein [Saccharopolyspora hordei]
MEFHKSQHRLVMAVVFLALGVAGSALMTVWADQVGRIPVLSVVSPVLLVMGIATLIGSLRPFTLRVDGRGILLEHPARRVRVELAWQQIEQVSVEKLPRPRGERGAATYLTVWLRGGENPGVPQKRAIRRDGRVGYRLLDVNDVRESADELRTTLSHYGASVFR